MKKVKVFSGNRSDITKATNGWMVENSDVVDVVDVKIVLNDHGYGILSVIYQEIVQL